MADARAAQEEAARGEAKRQPTEAERIEAAREARANLVKELVDFLEKPLEVHLREAVMKEMGLTEEKLAAMPPAERLAAEAMIAQKVRERLLERKDEGEQSAMDQPLRPGNEIVAVPDVQFSAERLATIMANSMATVAGKA
ncbi:MAG TPA: hypothetical protein DCX07_04610 [Phycisphaerales bacterium]|nr:hypothetical protein [Phycisphaerales bacterium]